MSQLAEGTIRANGVDFAYLTTGPDDGPLALCLHGFPDTARSFRYLLPRLADAGFRAVAPYMRGYAPTAVPADGRYHVGALANDANALHEALGADGRAVIVGHDWGAAAVYPAIGHQPERWHRGVTLAVPPAAVLATTLLRYDQLKRSFYIWFFQLPLADFVVPADGLELVGRLWADWSPGYDAAEDLAWVRQSLGSAENVAAALGYYRALLDPTKQDPDLASVAAAAGAAPAKPVRYLHGRDDGCIGVEVAESARAWFAEPSEVVVVDGVGHFLHLEAPEVVNDLVVGFLSGSPGPT